ncbi:MAG: MMPL family transporter [Treponema sp.]|nr:MMPL family transporter [Treponema sp.]
MLREKLRKFLNTKILVSIWLIFHGGILLAFLSSALMRGVKIDSDLFHMLPSSTLGEAMGKADEKLSDITSKNVFILVGHKDFNEAKKTAGMVYESLKDDDNFTSLSLYSGSESISEIEDFVAKYRWQLLTDEDTALLSEEGGPAQFSENALQRAFGSFTLTSLSSLEEDPFLLDELNTQNFLLSAKEASTQMQSKDGVLASFYENLWYVMIRGSLSAKGSAIASKTNGIAHIYDVCSPLEKDGLRFVYSGSAFHSHKSSTSAVVEIGNISTFSLSIVIIMLFLIFKSPLPLLSSVISILISMGTAFCATMLFFGEIHILTLILGTSLIGSCIDYSLHYFVNWKANTNLKTTAEIRNHLAKGLFLSMLSTEICYLLLTFAPFTILRQMGIFSSTGILSSFFTVVALFPLFPLPKEKNRKMTHAMRRLLSKILKKPSGLPKGKKAPLPARIRKYSPLIFLLILASIICVHIKNLRIENDMNKLYTMEGRVKEDTELCTQITGYHPVGWFIVSGKTEEELLQNEEEICSKLDKIQDRGYLATSKFIPSQKKQSESSDAAKNLLDYADEQFAILGFDEETAGNFKKNFNSALSKRLLPGENLPSSLNSIKKMLWLGEIDGKYYSIVLPVKITDEEAYIKIANENGNAYYENKMKDLGLGLDSLTRLVIILFCIAYVIILIVLKRFYTWKQTLKIASLPISCVFLILAVFVLIGQQIEFFSLTGIVLVFGLGLDYIIYMLENFKKQAKKQSLPDESSNEADFSHLEPFAITISFITTAISFGALAFSTFVPVHTIGLTITLGLIAAFISTML